MGSRKRYCPVCKKETTFTDYHDHFINGIERCSECFILLGDIPNLPPRIADSGEVSLREA